MQYLYFDGIIEHRFQFLIALTGTQLTRKHCKHAYDHIQKNPSRTFIPHAFIFRFRYSIILYLPVAMLRWQYAKLREYLMAPNRHRFLCRRMFTLHYFYWFVHCSVVYMSLVDLWFHVPIHIIWTLSMKEKYQLKISTKFKIYWTVHTRKNNFICVLSHYFMKCLYSVYLIQVFAS